MAKRLETLQPGTAVYCGDKRIGEVRGVFAEGESRLAEYLSVYWGDRSTEVLVPTNVVGTIDDRGVVLESTDPLAYRDLPAFDPAKFPTIRPLH